MPQVLRNVPITIPPDIGVKKGNTQVTTDKKQEPKKITEYLETIRELVRLTGKYAADCRNMEELA